ncbi:MAG: hypothetical protein HQL66_14360, partial [Magnetococcales bacterium]|nr:hypothetical protein [Magnetococcales bacterium]
MENFLNLHREAVSGVISTFDRLIFKGHLNSFFPNGAFNRYLDQCGVLLVNAKKFLEKESYIIKSHAITMAENAGRPYIYLEGAHTHNSK